MKTNSLVCCLSMFVLIQVFAPNRECYGQIERIKDKVLNRKDQKINNAEERALDKVEDAVDNLFKKKQKNSDSKEPTEKEESSKVESDKSETNQKPVESSIEAYRKFDFVRGAKTIYFDNFENEEISDYPKSWLSNMGGEIVTLKDIPGKWLQLSHESKHSPEYLDSLPKNFTFEFDLIATEADQYKTYNDLTIAFSAYFPDESVGISPGNLNGFKTEIDFFHDEIDSQNWAGGDNTKNFIPVQARIVGANMPNLNELNGKIMHLAFVRQDSRMKFYINATKVYDINSAFIKGINLKKFLLEAYSTDEEGKHGMYVSNFLLAHSIPDLRGDFMVSGKYSTNAILFETNKADITPSSLSTITMIANYMKTNPSIKLKVVGHTDNVGDDNSNKILSQKRAESVVKELINIHKIESGRLSAEGKGESEPTTANDSPENRAKNRRVEFIKL